jgi:hypothetical protein
VSAQLLANLHRAGWFDLARSYPDRGPLYEVDWYNALLQFGSGGAGAVVAANADGVRLAVGSGLSAMFVPWSEVTVSGKRGWLGTVIHLHTRVNPSSPLILHLDDADADAILRPAGVLLPTRRWRWGPSVCIAGAIGVLVALLGLALLLGT